MFAVRPMFGRCGHNVLFDPFDSFSYDTIAIGDDVFIGQGAVFLASESSITIGNKVMFGPGVMMLGGDHNTSVVGCYMFDVKVKRPDDDLPIVIEDDVWVGARAIILKGVRIGRGSIVAAGSIVTRTVPEFTVVGGVPARPIRARFSAEDRARHVRWLETENAAAR